MQMGVMVLLFQISSSRYIQCYIYHACGVYLSFIRLYLPAIGKTCMHVLETLKSLAGCRSSLHISDPHRSSQRIPQVH